MKLLALTLLSTLLFMVACEQKTDKSNTNSPSKVETSKKIEKKSFGKTKDGKMAQLFVLKNSKGTEVGLTDYGATVVFLKTADKDGKFDDIVLGFDSVEGYTTDAYLKANPYFGAIIGRYANRIAGAKFSIDGTEYKLAANNGKNNLHGGKVGFDKVFWNGKEVGDSAVEFNYLSKDTEEGFPGNLSAKVVYTLTEENELKIDYTATTDKTTVVNLTHHSYFNLAGHASGDILTHRLKINAEKFTPINAESIPFGDHKSVGGTPFDFRQAKEIGSDISSTDEQIKNGKGYDHNFVLNGEKGQMREAAVVFEPKSGRKLEIWTTEPGIQLYTGNYLDGTFGGKDGKAYGLRTGFCLETQHFPDSPNRKDFPSTVLKVGETYKTSTVHKFSISNGEK